MIARKKSNRPGREEAEKKHRRAMDLIKAVTHKLLFAPRRRLMHPGASLLSKTQPTGYCLVPEGRGDPANAVHNVIIAKGERIEIDKRHRWRAIDPPPRAAPQQGRLALELWATRAAL